MEGCQKCTISGQYINKRMSFPYTGCRERTDMDFRNRSIPQHHKENSILEDLPINMVDDFVTSDDLHLLHLGVMKKCLLMWRDGVNSFKGKWNDSDITKLNKLLKNIDHDMPSDIHRSIRDLNCLKFWKGSEFRTFLLYIGIIFLKDLLQEYEYKHFLKLYCGVILMSTDKYLTRNREKISNCARELFNEYILEYIDLYGKEYIGSNIHNLSHIVNDVLRFGNLTKISSYPFENCLYGLKLRVRNCHRPLEQISRRISELDLDFRKPINFDEEKIEPYMKYPFSHENELVYSQIFFNDFFLSSRNFGDKWFLSNDGQIVEFHFSFKRDTKYLLYGSCMKKLENFFEQPFSSKKVHVFSCNKDKLDPKYFEIDNVVAKMVCIHNGERYIFMPLLHTFK